MVCNQHIFQDLCIFIGYVVNKQYGGGPELSANDCCIQCVMENAKNVASANSFKNKRMKMRKLLEDAGATTGVGRHFFVSRAW